MVCGVRRGHGLSVIDLDLTALCIDLDLTALCIVPDLTAWCIVQTLDYPYQNLQIVALKREYSRDSQLRLYAQCASYGARCAVH